MFSKAITGNVINSVEAIEHVINLLPQPFKKASFMNITVLMNTYHPDAKGYDDTLAAIQRKEKNIISYCLDFACFSYMDAGYRIFVKRETETGDLLGVDLVELLENKRPYTEKLIKRAHNIPKMIRADAIRFLPLPEK